jgi:hypothetical protein
MALVITSKKISLTVFNQYISLILKINTLTLNLSLLRIALPTLRDSIRQPLHVFEGEDALLTCVVRNLESNTLLWKREDKERGAPRILTAGENRVISDLRFDILHDSGKHSTSTYNKNFFK